MPITNPPIWAKYAIPPPVPGAEEQPYNICNNIQNPKRIDAGI